MRRFPPILLPALAWMLAAATPQLSAAEVKVDADKLKLTIEIPRLSVSEYHRPYVAAWVQDQEGKAVVDLAVWYQVKDSGKESGTKWLPDLRQWWRRSGRNQEVLPDAVTAPTPPTGEHPVKIDAQRLAKLSPGKYTLFVEAVREVGGREMLEIPFAWPGDKAATYEAKGRNELGKITMTVKP